MKGKNTKENVGKFINLLYMHLNEYTGFRTFNVDNVCGIYGLDPKIMDILVDKKALSKRGTNGLSEYDWGSTPVTNTFSEEVYKALNVSKEEVKVEVITKKEEVMKKTKNHNQSISQAEIDYVAKNYNSKRRVKSIANTINRTTNSVYVIRGLLKKGKYTSEFFKGAKPFAETKPKSTRLSKKVTDEDLGVIERTMNLDVGEVAKMMDRTVAAVYSLRSKVRLGGFTKVKPEEVKRIKPIKAIAKKKKIAEEVDMEHMLPPLPPLSEVFNALDKLEEIKEERMAKNDGSRYKRIVLFWGMFTYHSKY